MTTIQLSSDKYLKQCVHYLIPHIQMCVKYRSSHAHTSKFWWHLIRLQRYANINKIEQYFDNNTAPRAATISIMKQCVHYLIPHIQMCVKYRSSHAHTSKFWWHLIRLQRYANINKIEQYFDKILRAATKYNVRTLFNSAWCVSNTDLVMLTQVFDTHSNVRQLQIEHVRNCLCNRCVYLFISVCQILWVTQVSI